MGSTPAAASSFSVSALSAGARLANEKDLARQRRQRQPSIGQRMVGWCDDHVRMLADGLRLDRQIVRRPAHDRKVEGEVAQRLDGHRAIADREPKVDERPVAAKRGEREGCEILGRADHTDRDLAVLDAAQGRQRVGAFDQRRVDPGMRREQLPAGRCRHQPVGAPLGERHAAERFELAQVQPDRRRRDVERLRGAGDGSCLGHRPQRAQLLQADGPAERRKFFFHDPKDI